MTDALITLARRKAAHARWKRVSDRGAATAPARSAFMARFEREVDPDGVLSPMVRAQQARSAMQEYMADLALRRVRTRQKAQQGAA